MAVIELEVSTRETSGKGGARKLRREGQVPGILYSKTENVAVAVDNRGFSKLLRHISSGNAILDLKVQGREGEEIKALIKEVQRDPVSDGVLHVDLEHIQMDQKVRVLVPVNLLGESKGVKDGGILEYLVRELEVECVASSIPASIDIDIADLDKNESIHVQDLIKDDLHILNSPDQTIVAVVSKAKEEEVEVDAEAEVEGAAAAPAEGEEPKEGSES